MLKIITLAVVLLLPGAAFAEERSLSVQGGQVSTPVGLTVRVKSITVSGDATTVHLLASFDSHRTNSVNMNDAENAYLAWGEGEEQRLSLRQVRDNRWLRIANGQTMEGALVFPGVIPPEAARLTLVFNPGRSGHDTNAPGVTVPLELKP